MNDVTVERILADIAGAGQQLHALEAAEGSAGNISVFARELRGCDGFAPSGELPLPVAVPKLAGGWIVVTASGCRLRDVGECANRTVVVARILEGGTQAICYGARDLRPSSEWNTHLAAHCDAVRCRDIGYHAVVHAQPHHLTYLSHHPAYADTKRLNDRLLRWQPETIVTFPFGIGMAPFHVPGAAEQMADTVELLRAHHLVVWQKHGVVARSDRSAGCAADLVEYAEAAARYEVLNLRLGQPSFGLTDAELRAICDGYHMSPPDFLGSASPDESV